MNRGTWKAFELKIAKALGGQRNPLSGKNSKHTAGDVIHPELYVEVKLKSRIPFWNDWTKAKENAKKEGKFPILVFRKKGETGAVAMLPFEEIIE